MLAQKVAASAHAATSNAMRATSVSRKPCAFAQLAHAPVERPKSAPLSTHRARAHRSAHDSKSAARHRRERALRALAWRAVGRGRAADRARSA